MQVDIPIIASKTFSLAIVVQCSPLLTDLSLSFSNIKISLSSSKLLANKNYIELLFFKIYQVLRLRDLKC